MPSPRWLFTLGIKSSLPKTSQMCLQAIQIFTGPAAETKSNTGWGGGVDHGSTHVNLLWVPQGFPQVSVEVGKRACHGRVHRRLRNHPTQVCLNVACQQALVWTLLKWNTKPATRMVISTNKFWSLFTPVKTYPTR